MIKIRYHIWKHELYFMQKTYEGHNQSHPNQDHQRLRSPKMWDFLKELHWPKMWDISLKGPVGLKMWDIS